MNELIFRLLMQSQITSFTKEDVSLQLRSHKDYPSVKAITDTLDYFGIENIAANVPKDALQQLPKLFLALIEKEGNTELVFVTQLKNGIRIRTIQNKKQNLSFEEFTTEWTGTIIAIEHDEEKASLVRTQSNFTGIILVSTLLFAIVVALLFTSKVTYAFYTFLTVVGGVISYLISKESIGIKDAISEKVCGVLSSKVNSCQTVIKSNEGAIYQGFGLGDASVVYFTSLFFITIFLGVQTSMLLVLSIGTLFVVAYSIYLQAIQLKQWCGLCLLVSAVLISQSVTLSILFTGWEFSFDYFVKASVINLSITILWYYTKPLILKGQELRSVKQEYLKFKRNEIFFNKALKEEYIENVHHLPKEAQVYFGNQEAPVQITAYTNPLCGYCVAAFKAYDKLFAQYPDDMAIQFVFNTPADAKNPSTQIAKRILEIYHKNEFKAFEALKDWFLHRDIDQWVKKYGEANSMLLLNDQILQKHRDLTIKNDIQYTPETLFGTYKFPRKYYEYEDLLLFVDALKTQNKTHQKIEI